MGTVPLHAEAQKLLCRSVCQWSGLPLNEEEARERTREFAAMIDGAGTAGPRNWKGLILRSRTERWARDKIKHVREGRIEATPGSTLHAMAHHRDESGQLLSTRTAAVELLNVLRPTVAVARFITFAALALHEHPEARAYVEALEEDALEHFAQEVRRYYPFFPVIAGKALRPFEWRGLRFKEGQWVILDLYGTNHDPVLWTSPGSFQPEHFREWKGNAYSLIPQGAGDAHTTHRCPGERIALELMKESVRLLMSETSYDVPEQDLKIPLNRFPTLPASGFLMQLRPSTSPTG